MIGFLNDVEEAAVMAFHDNEGMRESVKKVFLAAIYNNGQLKQGKFATPLINSALTFVNQNPGADDTLVGQNLRAYFRAVMMLEEGFKYIEGLKKVGKKEEPKINRAR